MSTNPEMPANIQKMMDQNEYRPSLPQRPVHPTNVEGQHESEWPVYNPADYEQPQTQVTNPQIGEYQAYNPAHHQSQPLPAHSLPQTDEWPQYNAADYSEKPEIASFAPPPQRNFQTTDMTDPAIQYLRDPRKLTAYLVPLPNPNLKDVNSMAIPTRFMIYTPPAPMLKAPPEGVKEGKLHKIQRKWQEEVRTAKTSDAKLASWQGVKGKATKGINWAMNKTTSSNLDFLGRVSPGPTSDSDEEHHSDINQKGKKDKSKKLKAEIEEITLIYPSSITMSEHELREEFVNSMLRTKSKAQRDTVIATGLMPISYGIDILATLIWPFGGLGEINTVWAYKSFKGAKTARDVTKRLSTTDGPQAAGRAREVDGSEKPPIYPPTDPAIHKSEGDLEAGLPNPSASHLQPPSQTNLVKSKDQLRLTLTPSSHVEVLTHYLVAECHKANSKMFPGYFTSPTETQVMEAIGWVPSTTLPHSGVLTHPEDQGTAIHASTLPPDNIGSGNVSQTQVNSSAATAKPQPTAEEIKRKHAEDTAYEISQFKEDLKNEMRKAAREWEKWCKAFEKDPEKAMGLTKEKHEK